MVAKSKARHPRTHSPARAHSPSVANRLRRLSGGAKTALGLGVLGGVGTTGKFAFDVKKRGLKQTLKDYKDWWAGAPKASNAGYANALSRQSSVASTAAQAAHTTVLAQKGTDEQARAAARAAAAAAASGQSPSAAGAAAALNTPGNVLSARALVAGIRAQQSKGADKAADKGKSAAQTILNGKNATLARVEAVQNAANSVGAHAQTQGAENPTSATTLQQVAKQADGALDAETPRQAAALLAAASDNLKRYIRMNMNITGAEPENPVIPKTEGKYTIQTMGVPKQILPAGMYKKLQGREYTQAQIKAMLNRVESEYAAALKNRWEKLNRKQQHNSLFASAS